MRNLSRSAFLALTALAASACASSEPAAAPGPNEVRPAAPVVLPAEPHIPGANAPLPAAPAGVDRDVLTYRMHVDGMTCPTKCVREVKEMLANVAGIVNLAVDSPTQTVVVNVVKGTDPQTLVDAIKAPYKARLL